MADISITAANVLAGSDAKKRRVTAGATVTAGAALYRDPADGEYKLADADAEATAGCDGIALTGGADGQPIIVAVPSLGGTINLGATLAVGQTYVVSTTAGGIAPISDMATGDFTSIIGVATSTSILKFGYLAPKTAKA